jgi:hypothetical protein
MLTPATIRSRARAAASCSQASSSRSKRASACVPGRMAANLTKQVSLPASPAPRWQMAKPLSPELSPLISARLYKRLLPRTNAGDERRGCGTPRLSTFAWVLGSARSTTPSGGKEMKGFVPLLVLASVLMALMVTSASADPGSNNPQVQYRTFTCDNGQTYSGGFVGFAAADFFIDGSTSTFAIKIFTEFLPSGPKTFYTGISGFDPSTLVTCTYTDPQGIFNIFSGFLTPRS